VIDSNALPPRLLSLVKTVAKSEEEVIGIAVAAVVAVAGVALIALVIFVAVVVGLLMLIF
jgi:hypothetical protein